MHCNIHTAEFNAVEQPETKKAEVKGVLQWSVTPDGLCWRDNEGAKGERKPIPQNPKADEFLLPVCSDAGNTHQARGGHPVLAPR